MKMPTTDLAYLVSQHPELRVLIQKEGSKLSEEEKASLRKKYPAAAHLIR